MKNKFYRDRNNRKQVGTISTDQFRRMASMPPRKLMDYLNDSWNWIPLVKVYEYDDGMYVGAKNLYARVNNVTADRIRGLLKYVEDNTQE